MLEKKQDQVAEDAETKFLRNMTGYVLENQIKKVRN